ncbi:lysylphosphatidylglycerol synthase transmembrane domain-containing protein [Salinivirga cyanobacteriivorans]
MEKKKQYRYLKMAFKIAFVAAALWFVFSKIDGKSVFETIRNANPLLIVASVVMFALSKVVAAFRLKYLFDAINVGMGHKLNLKLYWLSMFYNTFLPGGIGGDGYKVWWIQKFTNVNTKKVLGAVLLDRGSGLHAIVILALALTFFIPYAMPMQQWYFTLIPVAYIALWFVVVAFFPNYKGEFFRISGLSLIVQIGQVLTAFFVLLAFGVEMNFLSYLLVFLISSIAIIIPVSIGGVGLRELVFFYGSQWFGLHTETSIALALTIYFVTVIVNFSGVYFFIKTPQYDGTNMKEEQSETLLS